MMKKIIFITILSLCFLFVCRENVLSKSRFEKDPFGSEEFNGGYRPNSKFEEIEWKAFAQDGQAYIMSPNNLYCEKGLLHLKCIKQELHGKNVHLLELTQKQGR